jgi:autotransporter-associated beta strand protein
MRKKYPLVICMAAMPAALALGQTVSFPGAVGFGDTATGGRGGSIYVVTNLNSSGAGSFEDAVSESNRIIVFAVGGDVQMSAAISCASNLTILGQTAPGEGIAFLGHEVSFNDSSNCIIQYIRAREGSTDTSAKASINLGGTSDMILDHVDAEFSQYDNIDAVGSPTTTNNITLQNSLIADPIKAQVFNMHTEGSNTTYENNIFANAEGRSVLAKSNTQFVNNVIYDYGYAYTTGNSGGVYSYDLLDNYFVAGQSTTSPGDAWYQLDSNQSAYSSGNLLDTNKNGVLDGSATTPGGVNTLTSEWSPTTQYLPTLSATAAYAFDLAHAGDLYSNGNGTFSRDDVDTQIASQVASYGTSGTILNEPDDDGISGNGGLGSLPTASASANTLDTVPFTWLTEHGLSTTSATDLTLPNALGYDMIEEYAQQIQDQYASQTATSGDWATTTWSSTTPGIYNHALIRGNGTTNGAVTIGSSDSDNAFSVSIGGNGPAAGETLSISGGSLVVQDTIYVGDQNNGTLNISGGTVRTTNIQLGNTVYDSNGNPTNYTGTFNFTGGTLQLMAEIVQGVGTAGSWTSGANWTWSGGTIQALGAFTISAPATIGSGGAIINNNDFNGTISAALGGTGAFTTSGAGVVTLSGSNSYSGGTNINGGELSISSDANVGGSTSTINFNGGFLQVTGTTLTNLNSHTVNWSTFNGGFDISNSANTFTVSQNIGGTGSLTVAGAGTLVLSGTNTFSGGVTVIGGVLSVSADANLGAVGNPLTLNGGTLDVVGTALTSTADHPLGTFGGGTFDISTSGAVFTISQQVNGTGNLTKTGPGTLILGTRDYFTGTTTLAGGTLEIDDPLSLRYTTVNLTTSGITLNLNGINATIGGLSGSQGFDLKGTQILVGNNNANTTYSGVISDSVGGGSITKIGTGTYSPTGNSMYTGPTIINSGILALTTAVNGSTASPLGASTNSVSNLVLNGGTLQFLLAANGSTDRLFNITASGGTIDSSGADPITLSNTAALVPTAAANVTLTLTGTNTGHNYFNANLSNPASGYTTSLIKNGAGQWDFNGPTNTYSGDTDINAGTFETVGSNTLSHNSNMVVASGATLDFHGESETVNALEGAGTVTDSFDTASNVFTIGAANGSGTFSGNLGNGSLPNVIKTGTGTQILSGTDTYTGTTTINGGILQFNSDAAIGGTGASVTIAAGAIDAAGFAMDQTFLGRITTASTGTAALDVADATNLNFSAAGADLPNVSLGAIAPVSYTGTITPFGTTYMLGGGTSTLTLPNTNALTGANNVVISGTSSTIALSSANNYSGTTTISSGTLQALAANVFSPASDITINTGGNLDLHNFSQSIGALSGSGSVVNTSASGTTTLTLGGTNDSATFAGTISSAATLNLVKIGTGTQTLSGATTYTGSTTANAGTLTLDYAGSTLSTSFVAASGATLNINQAVPITSTLTANGNINLGKNATTGILSRSVSALNIGSAGILTVASPSAPANRTVLATAPPNFTTGGTLNLTGNDLIVHSANPTTVFDEIQSGLAGSGGITSSSASSDTTLGMELNNNGSNAVITSTFDGQPVIDTDVLVKYTYFGDANLSGTVNAADYEAIDNGFNSQTGPDPLTGWINGDFNYDGKINGDDYTLIDNAFNAQGGVSLASVPTLPTEMIADATSQIAAVPEPGTFGLLTLGGALLTRRRRKNSRLC